MLSECFFGSKKWGSKLDPFVRYPVLFVSCPWHATVDLVRGRVSKTNVVLTNVGLVSAAGLPPLSLGAVIIGCLFSDFDWTSRYRGAWSPLFFFPSQLPGLCRPDLWPTHKFLLFLSRYWVTTVHNYDMTFVGWHTSPRRSQNRICSESGQKFLFSKKIVGIDVSGFRFTVIIPRGCGVETPYAIFSEPRFPTNIWRSLFEKETWKEKPPR